MSNILFENRPSRSKLCLQASFLQIIFGNGFFVHYVRGINAIRSFVTVILSLRTSLYYAYENYIQMKIRNKHEAVESRPRKLSILNNFEQLLCKKCKLIQLELLGDTRYMHCN